MGVNVEITASQMVDDEFIEELPNKEIAEANKEIAEGSKEIAEGSKEIVKEEEKDARVEAVRKSFFAF